MNIKISRGNKKIGGVGNFSLSPLASCSREACLTCGIEGCYALKSYRMYPNVKNAWDHNLEIVEKYLDVFEHDMVQYLKKYKKLFFRIHVAGDFVSLQYFNRWIDIIKQFPHITFLAYTKQFDNIHDGIPNNFKLYISEWSSEVDIYPQLPRASMHEHAYLGSKFVCLGDCTECHHCYTGKDVVFLKH